MPFLAPLAPALPAIGGTIAGWLGGGKPGRDDTEKQLFQRQLGLTDAQMKMLQGLQDYTGQIQPWATSGLTQTGDWYPYATSGFQFAEEMGNKGAGFLDQASQAFTPSMDYFTKVLSGGPEMMMALSPELRATSDAFNQAKQQVSQFAPMGGGRANALTQLPFQQGAAVSDIISRVRPQAAAGLSNIGAQAGGLGTALTGQRAGLTSSLASDMTNLTSNLVRDVGSNYAQGASGAGKTLQDLMQSEFDRRQQGANRGGALGAGVYDILKNIKWGF